jgi:hypothetical protein
MLVLQAHSLAICPGAFNKIPGFFMSRDLPEADARSLNMDYLRKGEIK